MTIDDIIAHVTAHENVVTMRPQEGDGTPELAWGDVFFFYSPTRSIPPTQPFATIVTKDYPDDTGSRLDPPGRFRLNIAAGREAFERHVGAAPREHTPEPTPHLDDRIFAHPVYGAHGWLAVVEPGEATDAAARELLDTAYEAARRRRERRTERET